MKTVTLPDGTLARVIQEDTDGTITTVHGHTSPPDVEVITKYVHKDHGDKIYHKDATPRIKCVFTIRKFGKEYFAYYEAYNTNGREALAGNMLHTRNTMGLTDLKQLIDSCYTLPQVAKEFAGINHFVAPKY